MCIGKNKRAVFGFLAERVGHKLQGWSNKKMYKEGKLILLKSLHKQFQILDVFVSDST